MQIASNVHGLPHRRTDSLRILRSGLLLIALCLTSLVAADSRAQAPLYLVDKNTTVRKISFKFIGGSTIESDVLKNHIATTEPSFFDKVKRLWEKT